MATRLNRPDEASDSYRGVIPRRLRALESGPVHPLAGDRAERHHHLTHQVHQTRMECQAGKTAPVQQVVQVLVAEYLTEPGREGSQKKGGQVDTQVCTCVGIFCS